MLVLLMSLLATVEFVNLVQRINQYLCFKIVLAFLLLNLLNNLKILQPLVILSKNVAQDNTLTMNKIVANSVSLGNILMAIIRLACFALNRNHFLIPLTTAQNVQ